ncbi:partial isoleucyl-tRNA synthetase, partial [Methylococcales bacterium]
YYARESWFIRTTEYAPKMVELNNTINWYPPEVGSGRFGNWLEENKDWALSRDRFWATPLPVWVSDDGDMFAVGSIEELKQGFVEQDGKRITVDEAGELDLHKPFVDRILFEKNGKIYRRTPELIDVWYDSGAMPFAQFHYPFENKEWFEANFPADFISEGIDQTRGWFYTLHAISTMLFGKVAYKNLVVNDLILDEKGQKMSKSRGNAVDPFQLFDKYGADATRWYLTVINPPWRPTLFNEEDLAEIQRKFFGTLMNTYNFFALYANIDGFTGKEQPVAINTRMEIDRWILSRLNTLVAQVEKYMEAYDITKAARAIQQFVIDELSNWYVRRSRKRFWKNEMNTAKLSAYQTLHECLVKISQLISPFAPFIAEELYRNLTGGKEDDSVHLTLYPQAEYLDPALETKMENVLKVVTLARSMRAKNNLKIRQPLHKMMVAVDPARREDLLLMKDVILEELNIKTMEILTDDSGIVSKSAKPNFKAIGPRYGKKVNAVANAVKGFQEAQVAALEKGETVSFELDGEQITILPTDVEILHSEIKGWIVESEDGVIVALDMELNDELVQEGIAREFVNRVQNLRKDSGFDVTDRIHIFLKSDEKLWQAVGRFKEYILSETLGDHLEKTEKSDFTGTEVKIGEFTFVLHLEKVSLGKE